MVRGGSDFKVDIKRDYRGDIKDFREYFMRLKVFRSDSGRVNVGQE